MNRKEFVILLVITFIVIMIWLAFDIFFRTKPSVEADPNLQTIIEPINPKFDQTTLDQIKKNQTVTQ